MNCDTLIDYKGINLNYSNYTNCFKEEILEDEMYIVNLPPIQRVSKFTADISSNINSFIKIPKGKNHEDIILTGLQALVQLTLIGRVEYITTENNVNVVSFKHTHNVYISLPEDFQQTNKVSPKCYIQHMNLRPLDPKRFYFSILCLTTLEF